MILKKMVVDGKYFGGDFEDDFWNGTYFDEDNY